jgi:hypothetical protein
VPVVPATTLRTGQGNLLRDPFIAFATLARRHVGHIIQIG